MQKDLFHRQGDCSVTQTLLFARTVVTGFTKFCLRKQKLAAGGLDSETING
jgi:hypothetical protein